METVGSSACGRIRVGVGGWTYPPWRGNFYPKGLPHRRELEYASRRLTAIEINTTFYSTQTPATFSKWRDETPDDFVFSVKAPAFATNRRVLGGADESIERFMASGLSELGAKLGPILWQFAPTKRFDPDDFEAFLALLPATLDGRPLRHALEVRHESFMTSAFLALGRKYGAATVFADSDEYPSFSDSTGDFVYARLMRCTTDFEAGYAPLVLDKWAARARVWAAGGSPDDLPRIEPNSGFDRAFGSDGHPTERDVFVFFISGAKERAPRAACALLDRVGECSPTVI